jgi:hypothetical protein
VATVRRPVGAKRRGKEPPSFHGFRVARRAAADGSPVATVRRPVGAKNGSSKLQVQSSKLTAKERKFQSLPARLKGGFQGSEPARPWRVQSYHGALNGFSVVGAALRGCPPFCCRAQGSPGPAPASRGSAAGLLPVPGSPFPPRRSRFSPNPSSAFSAVNGSSKFKVQGSKFKVQSSKFKVQGSSGSRLPNPESRLPGLPARLKGGFPGLPRRAGIPDSHLCGVRPLLRSPADCQNGSP